MTATGFFYLDSWNEDTIGLDATNVFLRVFDNLFFMGGPARSGLADVILLLLYLDRMHVERTIVGALGRQI